MEIGASGYLTKGADLEEMITAIRKVHAGQHFLSACIAQKLAILKIMPQPTAPFSQLSERELQIAQMVANGLAIQEISDCLNLSPKTVNTYRYRLFEKLGINSDVQLTRMALRHGIVDAGD